MGSDVEMNYPAPVVGEYHEDEEDPKRHGGHYEEVGRSRLCEVIVEEGAPSLRREASVCAPFTWLQSRGKPGSRV
jgi:hypothetical protein